MSTSLSEKALGVTPSATLAITARAKELKAQGIDVVGFGAGEPDFDTPQNICDAAIKAINEGFTKYTPASGIIELKEAISRKFKEYNHVDYSPDQIVVSNGGKHSLINVFTALINPGDEVIIPAPYWLSYPEMVKLEEGVPVFPETVPDNGYKITVDELKQVVSPKTKALILNSPSNPTGMIYSEDELLALADFVVENDIYVISDEMYEYLVYDGYKHISIASLGDDIYKKTITVSGCSKTYAMTGWRIGYAAAPIEIAKAMSSIQSHQASNPNSIAQKAALEAISGPQDSLKMMITEFDKRRIYMADRLSKMPHIRSMKPEGAFYAFVDCTEVSKMKYKGEAIGSSARIAEILINDYNTAVIPCDAFGIKDHIRLSYAISIEQIGKGLDRIEKFLNDITE